MRAAGYDASKDYDKAIADLDTAIGLNDGDADYYLLRGLVYGNKADYDKALTDLNKKIELDPKAMNGYSSRAELYRKRKEYDLSIADLPRKSSEFDPETAKGYVDSRLGLRAERRSRQSGLRLRHGPQDPKHQRARRLVGRGVVKSRTGEPTDGSADLRMARAGSSPASSKRSASSA